MNIVSFMKKSTFAFTKGVLLLSTKKGSPNAKIEGVGVLFSTLLFVLIKTSDEDDVKDFYFNLTELMKAIPRLTLS